MVPSPEATAPGTAPAEPAGPETLGTREPPELDRSDALLFASAMRALRRNGIPFLVAGAYAVYQYTGVWRDTKDLDLVILPADRDAAIRTLRETGLRDYFSVQPYDRSWIHRTHRGATIVDLIWSFANRVAAADAGWFARARAGEFAGEPVEFLSPGDVVWVKLFVLQRTRCDWPDVLNVIRGVRGRLNWQALLEGLGPHWPLLRGVVQIYDWLCPGERHFIPAPFRAILEERARAAPPPAEPCRAGILDSRPWLAEPGAGPLSGP